jgi:hypothetical protein
MSLFYTLSFFSSTTDAMLYYPASVVYLSVCLDETTSIQMELLITLMARTIGLGSKFKKVFRFGLTQQTRDDSSLTNSLHPEGGQGGFFLYLFSSFFNRKKRPDQTRLDPVQTEWENRSTMLTIFFIFYFFIFFWLILIKILL